MAKKVPKDIQAVVDTAKRLANDEGIGYCQWANGRDQMCTGFVSLVFSTAGTITIYGDVHSAQPVNGDGWKTYPFDASKVWPGDVLISQGTHAGIAVGWGGPVAEAVTSGPVPTAYTTYKDKKTDKEYKYVISFPKAGINNEKSKRYQAETVDNVCYEKTWHDPKEYYELNKYPYSHISVSKYNSLSSKEKSKYTYRYEDGYYSYKYGTLTKYKMYGEKFWPEEGDQGGEVIANGGVGDNGRTHIIRHIKSWLSIDHFEVPQLGGAVVYKIP